MIGSVLAVFRKEFRENLRDRRTVISALVFGPLFGPLLFAAALGLSIERGSSDSERPLQLAVVHAERAPNLVGFLRQYGVTVVTVNYDDTAARTAVHQHRHTLVLGIGSDFGRRLERSEPAPLALYTDASDAASGRDAARLQSLLAQYGALLGRLRLALRGVDPLLINTLAIEPVDVSTPASRAVLTLGVLSYLILLTTLMGGMYVAIDATAGERERGSLEPLLTVPVAREALMLGKLLATCAYMTLSLTLTVCAFAVVLQFVGLERFGMTANLGPGVAACIVLLSLPLVPLGAALMSLVAAATRSYREAQTYLGLVLILPTLPLAFAGALGLRASLPLMAVPSLSQHFLITSLLRDEPLEPSGVAVSVLATLSAGALLVFFAARLYRREALLG